MHITKNSFNIASDKLSKDQTRKKRIHVGTHEYLKSPGLDLI